MQGQSTCPKSPSQNFALSLYHDHFDLETGYLQPPCHAHAHLPGRACPAFSLSDPCQGQVTLSQSLSNQQGGAELSYLCLPYRTSRTPLMVWSTRCQPISNHPRSWETWRSETPRALRGSLPALGGDAGVSAAPSLPTSRRLSPFLLNRGVTPVAHHPDFFHHPLHPCTLPSHKHWTLAPRTQPSDHTMAGPLTLSLSAET